MPEKSIVIQIFDNKAEAEIAQGLLNTAGIKSFVSKDDVGGMYPGLQATGTGVSLKVRPSDAGRAKKILQGIKKSDGGSQSYAPSENLMAVLSLLVWVLFPLGASSILLGSAGQTFLTYIGISLVVLGAVLGIFVRLRKRKMGLSESPSKLSYFLIGLFLGVVVTGIVSWHSGTKQTQNDGVYKLDLNGDGKTDEWLTYRKGLLATVELDHNFDGKTDVWDTYGNGIISFSQVDTDFNGVSDVTYFYVNGILYSAEFRPNAAKTVAKKQIFKHGVLKEELIDKDMDGKFDQRIIFDYLENPIMTIPFR